MTGPAAAELASRAHTLLRGRGETLAVAESLTGGLIGATLTGVPGISAVFRGGVIAYATRAKADVLGVPAALLAEHGAVHPDVAVAMARGARGLLKATFGLAVTGVAGPEPQDGRPVGTVYTALAGPDQRHRVLELRLEGDRAAIRERTVESALSLLLDGVSETTAN
ncbi:CinA family protein [Actinorugispora endophytica]|uniref:Competence/damage-inducible protein cinA n=1 Tax=Actinorugispora endophytica TaxID=1605990 RepID=A0A4R6UXE3_9ACTN|nr:nicotinamide-nucleotide amidohydrolase family protein [Actinorugispora endophytica]TDQ52115.1 competence/damage-inducible protein cinA [Actinorugispora endophytica]